MSGERPDNRPEAESLPERPDRANVPRVGVDEWVASHEGRRERTLRARLGDRFARVPWFVWLALVVGPAALLPLLTDNEYIVRSIGFDTILFALLALGLNVVVGYAGLLDLGYVAFFGFGAYMYAFLSSEHFGIHWPTEVTILACIATTTVLGLLLGLPSRRLVGDYLAIVTLFFAQIFVVLAVNGDRITFPWKDGPTNITNGPNGIANVDPMEIAGIRIDTAERYFWAILAAFAVVVSVLHLVNQSRTGRAWRALREDPLAAEAMTIPVNRLKLLAFGFGAGVAGLCGSFYSAVNTGVFPQEYDLALLITIYAMLILGGAGSLPGAVLGAATIVITRELLAEPQESRWLFYGVTLLAILLIVRPLWKALALIAGVGVFGVLVRWVAENQWERAARGTTASEGGETDFVARASEQWVVLVQNPTRLANYAFVILIAAVLALTLLRGWWRLAAAVPVLYLAAFVWENRFVAEPSITRFIVLGAILVALMAARPQGLLGTQRVEIV